MNNSPLQESLILADAHVHIYPIFDLQELLKTALNNFLALPEVQSRKGPWAAFLFLAETKEEAWFSFLKKQAMENQKFSSQANGKWHFQATRETNSLSGPLNEDSGLFIIAGRQIKTAESLEVLALGTNQYIEEGRPIKEVIKEIGQQGALPVIPWGVGKWLGSRGRMISHLLELQESPPFFLGDSRNRPAFWPKPSLFKQAARKGIKNLSGSDPLPIPGQDREIGRYGFQLKGTINKDYPYKSIKELLLNPGILPVSYGRQEGPIRFFSNQVRLRATGR